MAARLGRDLRCTGPDLLEKYDPWKEKANLVWVCHNLWVQYRCTMDEVFLATNSIPCCGGP